MTSAACLQGRSRCWWTAPAPPRWSPAAPWSAWSWTGLASSASWVPVQTFSNVTSNSTTASSRCPSEGGACLSPHPHPNPPPPPSTISLLSPFYSPGPPMRFAFLSFFCSVCFPPFSFSSDFVCVCFTHKRYLSRRHASHWGDFQPFTSACYQLLYPLPCMHSHIPRYYLCSQRTRWLRFSFFLDSKTQKQDLWRRSGRL